LVGVTGTSIKNLFGPASKVIAYCAAKAWACAGGTP